MKNSDYSTFRESLKDHKWPSFFMFKFIVPIEKKEEILNIVPSPSVSLRESKNKKYVGVTSHVFVTSEDAVIDIYKQAATVEGVILL